MSGFGFTGAISIGGGGYICGLKSVTQSLSAGDNTVTHSIGAPYTVRGVTVLTSAGQKVEVEWNIINTTSLNINLSGGSIADAVINIYYSL